MFCRSCFLDVCWLHFKSPEWVERERRLTGLLHFFSGESRWRNLRRCSSWRYFSMVILLMVMRDVDCTVTATIEVWSFDLCGDGGRCNVWVVVVVAFVVAQEGRRVINGVTHSGSKLPIYSLTTLVCIEFLSSGENFNLKLRKGSHIQNHYEIDCFWLLAPGLHAMMMMWWLAFFDLMGWLCVCVVP